MLNSVFDDVVLSGSNKNRFHFILFYFRLYRIEIANFKSYPQTNKLLIYLLIILIEEGLQFNALPVKLG